MLYGRSSRHRNPSATNLGPLLILLLGCGLAGEAKSSTIVVPNADTKIPANSNATVDPNVHSQYIYAASQFPDQILDITSISFRLSGRYGVPFAYTNPDLTFVLSTDATPFSSPSLIYADNLSADAETVLDGPVTYGSASASGRVRAFDIVFHLTRNFDYDPALGALVLDVNSLGDFTGPGRDVWDFCQPCSGAVEALGSKPAGSAVSTGVYDEGFVTQFTYTAVPEPAPFPMFVAAIGMLALRRRAASSHARAAELDTDYALSHRSDHIPR